VIETLPLSPEQKAKINASVESLQKDLLKRIESTPIGSEIKSVIEIVSPSTVVAAAPPTVAAAPSTVVAAAAPTVIAAAPISAAAPPAPAEPQAEPPAEPALVAVQINAEDLESVRAFLQSKKA
jgi:hypothetical protein